MSFQCLMGSMSTGPSSPFDQPVSGNVKNHTVLQLCVTISQE